MRRLAGSCSHIFLNADRIFSTITKNQFWQFTLKTNAVFFVTVISDILKKNISESNPILETAADVAEKHYNQKKTGHETTRAESCRQLKNRKLFPGLHCCVNILLSSKMGPFPN